MRDRRRSEAVAGEGLLDRARAGDPRAFADIVRSHDDRLRALAYRLLGDAGRMDDVLQEAYLRAFRALPRFQGQAAVGTWLHRIVFNACMEELRAGARRPVPVDDPAAGQPTAVGPEDGVADRGALARALAALPHDQRAVVLLVDAQGFDYAGAAEVLGVAPGTIASRLSRAHARLRDELGAQR